MSDTQTVHFRVGADFGMTLMQIANEHILYTNDLDKAIRCYSESFGGEVPEEIIKDLIIGKSLVIVDEEEQCFNVVPRSEHPHLEGIYPDALDIPAFVAKKEKELIDHCESLDKGLDTIINKFRYKETYRLDIEVKSVMKYIYGQDKEFIADLMDELEYDDDLQQMKSLIKITKDFIEKSIKLSQMIARLGDMFDVKTQFVTYDLTNLAKKVQDIARAEFYTFTEGDDATLDAYMTASKEIDEVLTAGIEPVDINDGYSAGWLSPEGDYYALNGEIANMLHNQIGDALQEKGIVPMYENEEEEELDIKANPDAWLEQNGWVKIHGNWILYGGMFNDKLGEENIPMTDTQKNMIADYIENCHQCAVKLGFKQQMFSVGQFRLMDKIALHKFFEF